MDQQLRRCIGSKTFGIEPHDAPISDFPLQPSQKDGLGRLCKPHWREYTGALRRAAQARKTAAQEGSPGTASDVSNAVGDGADPGTRNAAQEDAALAQEPVQAGNGPGAGEATAQAAASVQPAKVRTPRTRRPRAPKGDPTVLAAADALLRATETLEGEATRRPWAATRSRRRSRRLPPDGSRRRSARPSRPEPRRSTPRRAACANHDGPRANVRGLALSGVWMRQLGLDVGTWAPTARGRRGCGCRRERDEGLAPAVESRE